MPFSGKKTLLLNPSDEWIKRTLSNFKASIVQNPSQGITVVFFAQRGHGRHWKQSSTKLKPNFFVGAVAGHTIFISLLEFFNYTVYHTV